MLARVSVSANYAQIPHAHSSNPPAPLSRQRTKKTKETDKQTVSEKNIKERKLSFHIAAELRRQWRLISWYLQRRQREQPRRCSPLISAGRGAPHRAAAPEPQVSPWWVGFIRLSPSQYHLLLSLRYSACLCVHVHMHVFMGSCLFLCVEWMHPRTSLKGMWIPGLRWDTAAQLGFLPVGGVVWVCVCVRKCKCELERDARRIKWLGASGSDTHTCREGAGAAAG